MNLQARDKRALLFLAAAILLAGVIWIATAPKGAPRAVVAPSETVESAEKRLVKLRQYAAAGPQKRQELDRLAKDLSKREKGVLAAATVGEAQSQLLEVVRRIAKNANPAVDVRQSQFSTPEALGESYGVVTVTVSFDCRIEQLVNMLADLANAPELVATDRLYISAANPKQKTMPVRLTVAGVVPRRLIPTRRVSPVAL